MTNTIGRLLSNLLGRRDWRDDVSAYLDGELSARERERVEARLAQSDEMQAYLDDLREMRSMLRGFAAEPARAPFQLTTDMLETRVTTEFRPGPLERALRVSMATAAIGVATFSAVVIFDAVDRPSVTFTTTSAGDASTSVPTARIVTQQVQAETSGAESAGQSAQSAQTAVAVVSIESSSGQAAQDAELPVEGDDSGEQATAAAYRVEEEEEAEQAWAAQEQAEQEQAQAEEAMEQEADEQAAAAEEADDEQAAEDPSRRALNAGHGSGDAEGQEVSAADVVEARDEQSEQSESSEAADRSAQPAAAAEPATEDEEPGAAAAEAVESSTDDSQAQPSAEAETSTQTRTVATSVRHSESEWPLEQRPQSSSVRLATDPSWEAPVQIALAIVAFGSTLAWFLLTVMDRRRQT